MTTSENYDEKVAALVKKIVSLMERTSDEEAIEVLTEALACIVTTASYLDTAVRTMSPEQRKETTELMRKQLREGGINVS